MRAVAERLVFRLAAAVESAMLLRLRPVSLIVYHPAADGVAQRARGALFHSLDNLLDGSAVRVDPGAFADVEHGGKEGRAGRVMGAHAAVVMDGDIPPA